MNFGHAARWVIGCLTSAYALAALAGAPFRLSGAEAIVSAFEAGGMRVAANVTSAVFTPLEAATDTGLVAVLFFLALAALVARTRTWPFSSAHGIFPMAATTAVLTATLILDNRPGVGFVVFPAAIALIVAVVLAIVAPGQNTPLQVAVGLPLLTAGAIVRVLVEIPVVLLTDTGDAQAVYADLVGDSGWSSARQAGHAPSAMGTARRIEGAAE